jgi:hypothetical protein
MSPIPLDGITVYETGRVFKDRMYELKQQEFWRILSASIEQEERELLQVKKQYNKLYKNTNTSHKYMKLTTQMVLTTGGVHAESVAEAKTNMAEVLAERKQLADQFKKECVEFKNEKLKASVLSVFPLVEAETGHAIRAKAGRLNMALATWRY